MTSWTARVEWAGALPADDRLDALIDALAPVHGAVGSEREDGRSSAHITYEAKTLRMATDEAMRLVTAALRSAGVPFALAGVEVLDTATADARLEDPSVPHLVSAPQIAELAGVSRERVRQWAALADFPAPVTDVGERYQFWAEPTVSRWLATHDRSPGRRVAGS